jgi:hypothetical protein
MPSFLRTQPAAIADPSSVTRWVVQFGRSHPSKLTTSLILVLLFVLVNIDLHVDESLSRPSFALVLS